jgi:hypothetical protein
MRRVLWKMLRPYLDYNPYGLFFSSSGRILEGLVGFVEALGDETELEVL